MMTIQTPAQLNAFHHEFFAEASRRSQLGLPYVHPQRTLDAAPAPAPVPVVEPICTGTYRHRGTIITLKEEVRQ